MRSRKLLVGLGIAGSVAALILLLLMAGVHFHEPGAGVLRLENQSREKVATAVIDVCGQRLIFSNLGPGKTAVATFAIRGPDSDYGYRVEFGSGRKMEGHTGYVTRGFEYNDRLLIGDGQVTLVSESAGQ